MDGFLEVNEPERVMAEQMQTQINHMHDASAHIPRTDICREAEAYGVMRELQLPGG